MNRHLESFRRQQWAMPRDILDGYINSSRSFKRDPFADAPAKKVDAMYANRDSGVRAGGIAVVPICGPLMQRDSFFTLFFGGSSYQRLIATFRQLAGDDSVSTVLLDIDSPGGSVGGIVEAAAEVRRLAESKRVVAIANPMCASAAYWLGSQAPEVVATPEALVGSIGVFMLHEDDSGYLEQNGIKMTYIKAGERKVDGNPFEPLSDRAAAEMQTIVDEDYRLFTTDVAAGRNVPASTVKSPDWGEGAVLTAKDAKKAGLVDRIATLNDTIARLAGSKSGSGSRADDEAEPTPVTGVVGHEPECNEHCDQANGIHYLGDGDTASAENELTPALEDTTEQPKSIDFDTERRLRRGRHIYR